MMAGTGRELAITHGAQFAAQRLLGDDDAKLLENPLAEIDDSPANHPMNRRDRAALDDRGERGAVRAVQPRSPSGRLAINQPVWPMRIELEHPVADDLKRHPADLRRLAARGAFVNRRQSQKPPGLRPVLRPLGRSSHHLSVVIAPKRNGHGEPPLFATLNQNPAASGIPTESSLQRFGIMPPLYSLFPPALLRTNQNVE